jgi:hypothetical protein
MMKKSNHIYLYLYDSLKINYCYKKIKLECGFKGLIFISLTISIVRILIWINLFDFIVFLFFLC